MLKQQDMTETARVVFNELSVTEPATVGEIAQNTYLSRERCQLILTQLVMAGLADYQCGCYRRLSPEGFFICGKWAAGGGAAPVSPLLMC
ncbi:hypothetical protein ECPV1177_00934 [Escherichia coli O145:H28]|nr:hypothetical protein ECPV1177_00934 [Escherichia coli O145:H28]